MRRNDCRCRSHHAASAPKTAAGAELVRSFWARDLLYRRRAAILASKRWCLTPLRMPLAFFARGSSARRSRAGFCVMRMRLVQWLLLDRFRGVAPFLVEAADVDGDHRFGDPLRGSLRRHRRRLCGLATRILGQPFDDAAVARRRRLSWSTAAGVGDGRPGGPGTRCPRPGTRLEIGGVGDDGMCARSVSRGRVRLVLGYVSAYVHWRAGVLVDSGYANFRSIYEVKPRARICQVGVGN